MTFGHSATTLNAYIIKELKYMKVAFFDIDGTFFRDSLLVEHFKLLFKEKLVSLDCWENKIRPKFLEWESRKGDYDDYLTETGINYLNSLKGQDKSKIVQLAQKLIEIKGEKVYKYTREKLEFHKKKGYKIIIISGSPDFLVKEFAKKYKIEDFIATVYKTDKFNKFNGQIEPMWDSISKRKAIEYFTKKYNINLKDSFAYGDTAGDFDLLKSVGNPIAVNPAAKLIDLIKNDSELSNKIEIVVERKDVIYSFNIQNI